MTIFEVGIIYGDDRGTRHPVRHYKLTRVRKDRTNAYLKDLFWLIDEGVRQAVPDSLGIHQEIWLVDISEISDADDDERNWYTPLLNRDVLPIPHDVKQAAAVVLEDLMSTDIWKDTLGVDDKDFARVDLSTIDLTDVTPSPVRLQVGQEVFNRAGEQYTYLGHLSSSEARYNDIIIDRANKTARGAEEFFIPVDFFDVKDYQPLIEVYPAPNEYWRRGRKWFARTKKTRQYEVFTALKADAVRSVALPLAFERFHPDA